MISILAKLAIVMISRLYRTRSLDVLDKTVKYFLYIDQ